MGLVNDDQRAVLLDLADRATKATAFSRELSRPSLLDHTKSISRKILDLSGAVVAPVAPPGTAAAKAKADVKIAAQLPKGHGFNPAGYYFAIHIDFALWDQDKNDLTPVPPFKTVSEKQELEDWGLHFGNPLVNPRRNTIYMVRCTLSQLRVEPLLGGFVLKWTKPGSWKWMDLQPIRTSVQVVSNPLVVTRLARSPATTISSAGFSVAVVAQFP